MPLIENLHGSHLRVKSQSLYRGGLVCSAALTNTIEGGSKNRRLFFTVPEAGHLKSGSDENLLGLQMTVFLLCAHPCDPPPPSYKATNLIKFGI